MDPIIRFENVHFTYPEGEREILCGIDLEIAEGSFVAVLGHNGSGKSTLAKHMNAILTPTQGKVWVRDLDTSDEEKLLDVRRTVGMVFQNPDNQIVANVVEDDVAFAPENLGVPSEEIRQRVDAALKQVGMYDFRMHAPHLLSGGQKQRVAIAGVLAMQPKVLALDEPTAMLDPQGRREVIDTVTRLCREKGMTVVLITHHMEECIGADRLVVMSNGSVVADGSPLEVFSQVELMQREGLDVPETTRVLHELGLPTDALDPEACDGVTILGCRFSVGDDCIAIKSGKIELAERFSWPAVRHTVRNCLMEYGHGAVTLGSESAMGIRALTVSQCYFRQTDRGLRIKTRRGRGEKCAITNITFENIRMDGVLTPVVINMWYNCCDPDRFSEYVWSREKLPVDGRTPHLGAFTFRDMVCTGAQVAACYIDGLPERPIDEVTFENVSVAFAPDARPGIPAMQNFARERCRLGLYCENVGAVRLINVRLAGVDGDEVIANNCGTVERS